MCDSVVYDFLSSRQLMNSVSVFVPESSLGTATLSQPDLLQALHLPASKAAGEGCSVLELCVSKLSRQVLPAFIEASSQTESGTGSVRGHLGEDTTCSMVRKNVVLGKCV